MACCDTNLLDLRIARSKHADFEQIVARVQQLPFKSESFDAVMILNAFRYFSDSPSALAESYRVITDEGSLILLDHNRRCPDSKLVTQDVIRYYTLTELTSLLGGAGFVPSSFKMLFIPPPVESAFLLAATLRLEQNSIALRRDSIQRFLSLQKKTGASLQMPLLMREINSKVDSSYSSCFEAERIRNGYHKHKSVVNTLLSKKTIRPEVPRVE